MPLDLPGCRSTSCASDIIYFERQGDYHLIVPAGAQQSAKSGETGHFVMDACGRETDAAGPLEIDRTELEIRELVGQGEFGEVYHTLWRGHSVAAKVFKESNPHAREVFQQELQALQRLQHPHIVEFLGACTGDKPHILVFELMTAGTLADVLRSKRRFSHVRALAIALDLARGLSYLHSLLPAPMMHRDLKPSNLLITGAPGQPREKLVHETGTVKLADFGLAKMLPPRDPEQPHRRYKLTGEAGSYRFMAPEICLHKEYNEKVDVWGFSMVLFQLLEHRAPFSGINGDDAAGLAALHGQRPAFAKLSQPCPSMQAMRHLVEQCWQEDPDVRPDFPAIIGTLELELTKLKTPAEHRFAMRGCVMM